MGTRLHQFKVSLNHFYQCLGSQNQTTYNQAVQYFDQKTAHYDLVFREQIREIFDIHLHKIIFDGNVENIGYIPINLTGLSEEQVQDLSTEQCIFIYMLEAIFSTAPNAFKTYGGYGHGRYSDLFEDLKSTFNLDNASKELWWYLLEGRPLGKGITSGFEYYAYLTHSEVEKLLANLANYRTSKGLKLLKQAGFEKIRSTVETFEEHLKDILESELELFVYAMF